MPRNGEKRMPTNGEDGIPIDVEVEMEAPPASEAEKASLEVEKYLRGDLLDVNQQLAEIEKEFEALEGARQGGRESVETRTSAKDGQPEEGAVFEEADIDDALANLDGAQTEQELIKGKMARQLEEQKIIKMFELEQRRKTLADNKVVLERVLTELIAGNTSPAREYIEPRKENFDKAVGDLLGEAQKLADKLMAKKLVDGKKVALTIALESVGRAIKSLRKIIIKKLEKEAGGIYQLRKDAQEEAILGENAGSSSPDSRQVEAAMKEFGLGEYYNYIKQNREPLFRLIHFYSVLLELGAYNEKLEALEAVNEALEAAEREE